MLLCQWWFLTRVHQEIHKRVFIKSVYVDDYNITGSTQAIDDTRNHLNTKSEMKGISIFFCFSYNLSIFTKEIGYTGSPIEIAGEIQYGQVISIRNSCGCSKSRSGKISIHIMEDGEGILGSDVPYLDDIRTNSSGKE